MLFHERVQDRNHIIVADRFLAVFIYVEILYVSLFIQHQISGESVGFHIVIIIHVVYGQYQGDLSLRHHGSGRDQSNSAVFRSLHLIQVMNVDQNVLIGIQFFQYGPEFIYGRHPVIISVFHVISVERQICIHDQRMKEDVTHRLFVGDKSVFGGSIGGGCFCNRRIF